MIAVGLLGVALAGPFGVDLVTYRVTDTLRAQTIGLDAVALFVVAPLAVVAATLVLRDHAGGALIGLGVGTYSSYMALQYVVGPDYTTFPGDNERLFPVFAVLFAAGWLVAVGSWTALPMRDLPRFVGRERWLATITLPTLAVVAFVRYVPALADVLGGSPTDGTYVEGPTFFWTIALLDLGVFLPATVATILGIRRGVAWAAKAVFLLAGWFALVGTAVAGMSIAMAIEDVPAGSARSALSLALLGGAFVVVAVLLFEPAFERVDRR